jgi:hypothetical protein
LVVKGEALRPLLLGEAKEEVGKWPLATLITTPDSKLVSSASLTR